MTANIWPNRFDDQVAVVTGAADGLGNAIANRLIAEGGVVWFADINVELLNQRVLEAGSRARALPLDITDEDAVAKGFEAIVERDGRLDIAVNSAGIVGPNGVNIDDTPSDEYSQVLQVNLFGTFLVTKYAVRSMISRNYGRILAIASIAGKDGNAGMCAYSSSKAGVIGLVKSAGKEFATSGITINALAPAVIRTAMVDAMSVDQVEYMTSKIPMNRCDTLDEVASTACWIVSREASFNTGFVVDLSGGRAVY